VEAPSAIGILVGDEEFQAVGHIHLHCEITITEVLDTVQVDDDLGKKGSINLKG
jgi:hypothetical protein